MKVKVTAKVNTLKTALFGTIQANSLQKGLFKTYISDQSLTLSIFHDLQTKVKVTALKTALNCTNQAEDLRIRWFN